MSHVINVQLIEHKIQIMHFYIAFEASKVSNSMDSSSRTNAMTQHSTSLIVKCMYIYYSFYSPFHSPFPNPCPMSNHLIEFGLNVIQSPIESVRSMYVLNEQKKKKYPMIRNNGFGTGSCHLFYLIFVNKLNEHGRQILI